MFRIIKELQTFTCKSETLHIKERNKRITLANQLINNEHAKVCKICVVDKNHVNGMEIHVIYNNGVVKIYNYNTGKFITVLIAREKQVERYNVNLTDTMKRKIKNHIRNNYNYV